MSTDNLPANPVDYQAAFAAQVASLDVEASLTDNSLETWIQTKLGAIATADSFEAINAIMTESGMTAAKTMVGHTFEITDFFVRESADAYRENSMLKKWAAVKAVDTSTGADYLIDGGGDQFVMGLVRMRDLYGFPFTGTLLALTTAGGNDLQYWRFFDPKRKPNTGA